MLYKLVPYKYKKWSTLLGGILIQISLGSLYTFGNISPYITSYLREYAGINVRYSQSVWVLTASKSLFSISTLLSGLIKTSYNFNDRIFLLIGFILMSIGVSMSYFAINHSFLMIIFTYGALNGIGIGLAYLAPLSIAMKWFPDRKGFANSSILFGFGASSIIFNQVQTYYINPGNISPDKSYSNEYPDEKYFSKKHIDLLRRIPSLFLVLVSIYIILQAIGMSLICEYYIETNEKIQKNETNNVNNEYETRKEKNKLKDLNDEVNSLGVKYLLHDEGLSLKESLKKPIFYLFCIIMSTSGMGSSAVITYFKTFGQTFISDDKFLATVGSVSSIFNASGRLFWGFMIDRFSFKRSFLILTSSLIMLTCTIYYAKFIQIKEVYLLWVSAVLFFQCGLPVLLSTGTAKCFGQKHFTAIYGLIYLIGVPSSFGSAFLGSESDKIGWFWLFTIGSILSLIGWSMGFLFYVKKSNGDDI